MFEAADIREWRGHDVTDPDGQKIGELEAVYVDTGTDLLQQAIRCTNGVRAGRPDRGADPAAGGDAQAEHRCVGQMVHSAS